MQLRKEMSGEGGRKKEMEEMEEMEERGESAVLVLADVTA